MIKYEQYFFKYILQLIYNKALLIMTVLNRKSGTNKGNYRWIIVIALFLLVICEIQCIKFGRKQTNINNSPQDHTIETKMPSIDKVNQVKKQQIAQKQVEKLQKDNTKQVTDQKTPKIQQSKAQVSLTPTTATIPQQKPIQSIQSHPAIDSLFGSQQPAKEQTKQQKPQTSKTLTITPQKQQTTGASVLSTISTSPTASTSHEEVKNKDSILGGLFGEQNAKKTQVSQAKKQVKSTPTQVQKPTPSTTENNNPVSQAAPQSTPNALKEQPQKLKENEKKIEASKKENEIKKEQKEKQEKSEIKPQQKSQETKQQTQKQSDSDQEDQKTQKDNKEDQDQQSDDVIYSKDFHKSTQTSQFVHDHKQSQSKYSLTLLFTFCLYSVIIVMVIVTIKCTNTTSKAAKAVNVMVDAVGDMFKKKQGYRPALNEEEVTDREEEITVGYKVEDNQQIFWEKNSVEGI